MSSQRPNSAAIRALRRKRTIFWSVASGAMATLGITAAALLAAPTAAPLLMTVGGWHTETDPDAFETSTPHAEVLGIVPVDQFAPRGVDGAGNVELTVENVVEHDAPPADVETRWFNGRPIRPAGTIYMLVTAYSPDERSCGIHADGITASGYSVWTNGMKLVAADTSILPFGSLVSVPGYDGGEVVPVLDRGGKIKGNRLDVLYPSHEEALQWGAHRLEVVVWEYADGEPDDFRTNHRRR